MLVLFSYNAIFIVRLLLFRSPLLWESLLLQEKKKQIKYFWTFALVLKTNKSSWRPLHEDDEYDVYLANILMLVIVLGEVWSEMVVLTSYVDVLSKILLLKVIV